MRTATDIHRGEQSVAGASMLRIAGIVLVIVSVPGCNDQPRQPPTTLPTQTDTVALDSISVARGQLVFDSVCSACHTLEAPPKTAPPLGEIARRYRQVFTDREEAIDHLVDYTRSPAPAKSHLTQPAIDDWGVMPGVDIPEADLRAVGRYIWELATPRPR
jgi:mono/diheme cytochrome c family protein